MIENIVFCAIDDWANVGYELMQAVNVAGGVADLVVLHKHPFDYPNQDRYIMTKKTMCLSHEWADHIVFMHSQGFLFDEVDYSKKKIYVFHGGSIYREFYEEINKAFNPIVHKSIIQTRDLWDLGAERKVWLLPCVNTDTIIPGNYEQINKHKLTIGHFPSSQIKGTIQTIIPAINHVKNIFKFDFLLGDGCRGNRIPWSENLEKMRGCDIYIEAVYPDELKIKEWGVTALEAAALGKIVITNFKAAKIYEQEYGVKCPFIVSDNYDALVDALFFIHRLDKDGVKDLRIKTREWVEKYHSQRAVGEKMIKEVFS